LAFDAPSKGYSASNNMKTW